MVFGQSKKNQEVQASILEYCELIGRTVNEFGRMIREYIDWDKHFKKQSKKVHTMEHEADEMRRSIEKAMFAGAFLPAYRADYVVLLEVLDRVANKAEEAGDTLYLVRPDIPEEIRPEFVRIAELTIQAYEQIPKTVASIMQGENDIEDVDRLVEGKEQEVDKIQFNITRKLFKELELGKPDAMVIKLLIDQICSVSDRIENVMDRLSLIAITRQL
jgi:predicted phosphate transport protein (TIGR00153 family)